MNTITDVWTYRTIRFRQTRRAWEFLDSPPTPHQFDRWDSFFEISELEIVLDDEDREKIVKIFKRAIDRAYSGTVVSNKNFIQRGKENV